MQNNNRTNEIILDSTRIIIINSKRSIILIFPLLRIIIFKLRNLIDLAIDTPTYLTYRYTIIIVPVIENWPMRLISLNIIALNIYIYICVKCTCKCKNCNWIIYSVGLLLLETQPRVSRVKVQRWPKDRINRLNKLLPIPLLNQTWRKTFRLTFLAWRIICSHLFQIEILFHYFTNNACFPSLNESKTIIIRAIQWNDEHELRFYWKYRFEMMNR